MEAVVYGEMCKSMERFSSVFNSCGQTELIDSINAMIDLDEDPSTLIQTMLSDLDDDVLLKCYEVCEENGTTYTQERDAILAFLEGLKVNGQIIEYLTFSSTVEANKFDIQAAGMTEGGILWLLDRNFSRVGESEESGLKLAENILNRGEDSQNFIYILSAIEQGTDLKEDDVEEEFDKVLATQVLSDKHSFIYYISKRRLMTNDSRKIAKSLAQGFKRKACFELFQLFSSCLSDGVSKTTASVKNIRPVSCVFV